MKILFIHNALPEYRLACFRLIADKHDVQFLIVSKSVASKIYNFNFTIDKKLKIDYLEDIGGLDSLPQYINREAYDVMVIPPADTYKDLRVGQIALNAVRRKSIRTIYWTEKWEADREKQPILKWIKNRLHAIAIKNLTNRVDICVAASICTKKYFIETCKVPESRIIVLPHSNVSPLCTDDEDIRVKYGIPESAKIILFLGRLVPRKGCDILIKAFAQLVMKNKNYFLLIVGEGECLNELKLLVKDENVSNVIFAGKIEPARRAIYYQQSDVSCLPSYSYKGIIEAYGLTVNESLEQGTPVVTTTAVGAGHELHDNKTVIMVQENNISALTKALEFFLNIEDKIEQRQLCKVKFKEFSVERMANNFCKSFEMELD